MLLAITIFLAILVGLLGYLLYINFRKAERIEQYCEAYVKFIAALYIQFKGTREHMKEIDRLGAFRADDEVGMIFKEMDQSIDDLYEFITKYINVEQNEEKEKTKD